MINKEGLYDEFEIGTSWTVVKKDVYYYIYSKNEKANTCRINLRTAQYLGALFQAQLNNEDGWIAKNKLVLEVGGTNDPEDNTHNQYLSMLRKAFSKSLIENRARQMRSNDYGFYRLTEKIDLLETEKPNREKKFKLELNPGWLIPAILYISTVTLLTLLL